MRILFAVLLLSCSLFAQLLPAPSFPPYPDWSQVRETCSLTQSSPAPTCSESTIQHNHLWSAPPWVNHSGSTCTTYGVETGGPVACETWCTSLQDEYIPFLCVYEGIQTAWDWNSLAPPYATSGCNDVYSPGSYPYWSTNVSVVAATHMIFTGFMDYAFFYYLLSVPNESELIGMEIATQWARLDPNDDYLYFSRAREFTILP